MDHIRCTRTNHKARLRMTSLVGALKQNELPFHSHFIIKSDIKFTLAFSLLEIDGGC